MWDYCLIFVLFHCWNQSAMFFKSYFMKCSWGLFSSNLNWMSRCGIPPSFWKPETFFLNSISFIIPRQSLEETNPARKPPSMASWRILTTSLWLAPTPWGKKARPLRTKEPPAMVKATGKKMASSPSHSIQANLIPLLTTQPKSTEKRASMEMIWIRFIKAAMRPSKMGT